VHVSSLYTNSMFPFRVNPNARVKKSSKDKRRKGGRRKNQEIAQVAHETYQIPHCSQMPRKKMERRGKEAGAQHLFAAAIPDRGRPGCIPCRQAEGWGRKAPIKGRGKGGKKEATAR